MAKVRMHVGGEQVIVCQTGGEGGRERGKKRGRERRREGVREGERGRERERERERESKCKPKDLLQGPTSQRFQSLNNSTTLSI
jgi:hypothetical protein